MDASSKQTIFPGRGRCEHPFRRIAAIAGGDVHVRTPAHGQRYEALSIVSIRRRVHRGRQMNGRECDRETYSRKEERLVVLSLRHWDRLLSSASGSEVVEVGVGDMRGCYDREGSKQSRMAVLQDVEAHYAAKRWRAVVAI